MWQFVALLIGEIISYGISATPVLLAIAMLVSRRRIALPASVAGAERSVRLAQTIALACLTTCIVAIIASRFSWLTSPSSWLIGPGTFDGQRQLGQWGLGICAAACLGCILVSLRRSTVVATVLLAVVLMTAASLASRARYIQLPVSVQAEIAKTPIPVIITVDGTDRPVDVILNGVRMGKTPVRSTVEDIQSTIPVWEDIPEEFGPVRGPAHERYWSSLSINWSVLDGTDHSLKLFVKLERDGLPLVGRGGGGSGGQRAHAWISPCKWTAHLDPEISNQETDRLLNIARLQDYVVDTAWVDAFVEMVPGSWQHLLRNLTDEPGLNLVKTAVVRRFSRIEDVTDHESAWRLMDDILQRAVVRREFGFESLDAHIIELLVDERLEQLGQEELLARFELAVQQVGSLWRDISYLTDETGRRVPLRARDSGRVSFSSPSNDWTDADAMLHPLRHAVLRLDQRLDAGAESQAKAAGGNVVERRIVPMMLCLQRPEIDLASEIGGPIIEQFLLRHDWKRMPDSDEHSENVRRFGYDMLVSNAWFHRLIRLRSPLGKSFRNDQQGRILGELNQLVRSSGHGRNDSDVRAALGTCFVDDEARESLATTFWPTFDRYATTWPDRERHQVRLRWEYLTKMWPYSTAEQFASVYKAGKAMERRSAMPWSTLDRIPPDDVFRILDALIAATRERELNDETPETLQMQARLRKSIFAYHREGFETYQRNLPCAAAAERAVEHFLSLEDYQRKTMRERLVKLASRNSGWSEVFSKSESSEVRMMVPAATLRRPTPANRKAMKSLEDDESQSVRDSVVSVQAALAELLKNR